MSDLSLLRKILTCFFGHKHSVWKNSRDVLKERESVQVYKCGRINNNLVGESKKRPIARFIDRCEKVGLLK
jgi:hypothetical protein